jgi:HK97 family phage prohead protease
MEVRDISFEITPSDSDVKSLAERITTRGINIAEMKRACPEMDDEMMKASTFKFIASNASPDRMGDIINPKGWVLNNFKTNPMFLWQHNSHQAPIGVSLNEEQTIVNGKEALVMEIFFHGMTQQSRDALMLYKTGLMKAVSVGFRPITIKEIKDEAERASLGLGRWGVFFEKQELLELSAVTIPANQEALILNSAKDLINSKDYLALIVKNIKENHPEIVEARGLIDSLTKKVNELTERLNAPVIKTITKSNSPAPLSKESLEALFAGVRI